MKSILLSAAASLMLLGSAAAAEAGQAGPFGRATVHSSFAVNIPAVDTGSEAYPSTRASGSGEETSGRGLQWNQALLRGADTGSEQAPLGLR